jgi:hypothetical protein
MKKLFLVFIVIFLGFTSVVIGKNTEKDITIELRDIRVNVNDKKVKTDKEPFLYDEQVWIPINFLADHLGKHVEWDSKSNTVDIWDKKPDNSTPPGEKDPDEITVYVTETGKKYHTSTCKYLKDSKIEITLKEAKEKGYTPCSRCNPPN